MGLAYTALAALVRDGNNKVATKTLQDLYAALGSSEPKTAELYYRLARPFARLAGSDAGILTVTGMMLERAVALKSDHAPYVVEAGYNRLLLEDYAQAAEKFEAVLALDELSLKVSRVCHARGLIPFSRATFRV